MAEHATEKEKASLAKRLRHLDLSRRRWFFIPPAIAAALVTLAMLLVPGIEHSTQTGVTVPVEVQILTPTSVTPILKGFGDVRSKHTWQALAQVGGKVSWQHPDLLNGAQFAAETRLLTIDPLDYETASARADAQVRSARAHLAETNQRSNELDKAISIQQRAVELAKQRYTRNQQLAEQGHISRLQLDAEEQDLLRQQQSLQSLQTEKSLQPDKLEAAQARINEAYALQKKAIADLNRTEYYMPFNGRIDDVHTDTGQFVPTGSSMFTAENTEAVEVLMEVPYAQLLARFPSVLSDPTADETANKLAASLSYQTAQTKQIYVGKVSRINPGLNNNNRAVAVYIDLERTENSRLPPLNQYLDVTVSGPRLHNVFVIPRSAVHNGSIWLADADNRLQVRSVEVLYTQEDLAVLSAKSNTNLGNGAKLVTTNLLFPAAGMLLEPVVR